MLKFIEHIFFRYGATAPTLCRYYVLREGGAKRNAALDTVTYQNNGHLWASGFLIGLTLLFSFLSIDSALIWLFGTVAAAYVTNTSAASIAASLVRGAKKRG